MRNKFLLAISTAIVLATPVYAASLPSQEVASLRRLTQEEYRNSISDIFGSEIEVRGVFEPTIRVGGLQAASTTVLSVTPVGFESFTKMADSIAVQVTGEKYRSKLPCAPKDAKAADDACTGQILSHYGMMLFRRPLTSDEVNSRVALAHGLAEKQKDFYAGLRYGLASLLQASDFVFRKEVALPAADKKSYTLDPYSRATRLSYLLWNTTPDHELLDAAQKGDLNTQAGIDKQVDRLMASPRLEVGMRAFFNDMMELDTFDTVSKDSILYPKWGSAIANSAKEETLRTMIGLTLKENGDVRDLMTTRKTYVNRNLAAIYQLPFSFTGEWVPYEFSKDSGRSGLLTQTSMLAMFSHPGRSSPTKRGVALMDILLCEPTPAPPANVDFSVVNDTSGALKTVRERLMAHAGNPTCASCHNHSDPIGLTLEGFDTIGGRRTKENGAVIDVSAAIKGAKFAGGEGLGQYLHDNPKFPACVARKLFAYGRGENSEDVSASAFKASYKAFTDSGYHLKTLIKGMAASPEFYGAPTPSVETTSPATKVAAQ
ncbi:MAG TPA: DUF1592 domain-containing protein [Rhizomicrobium sp.]